MTEEGYLPVLAAYEQYQKLGVLGELAARSPFIPGIGHTSAPLMVVTDCPGPEASAAGTVFAGPSGDLLIDTLEATGLPAGLAYYTAVVKYRPPGGRALFPYEIVASAECLITEIRCVRPVVVATLGNAALQVLEMLSAPGGEIPRLEPWQYLGTAHFCHVLVLPTLDDALRHPEALEALVHGFEMIASTHAS